MLSIIDNDKYFHFEILNYQFPDTIDRSYDGNWLMIKIKADNGKYKWEKTDPSLLTWEVKELYQWFLNLSENKKNEYDDIGFTEPVISFKILENDNIKILLRICFAIELLPDNFDRSNPESPNRCFIDLAINIKDLNNIVNQLKEEMDKYPERK